MSGSGSPPLTRRFAGSRRSLSEPDNDTSIDPQTARFAGQPQCPQGVLKAWLDGQRATLYPDVVSRLASKGSSPDPGLKYSNLV
ncbi:hypothetical protein Cob_v002121 [Colletotrichum orbiculare MAFF 240422]|uniref:Uncharacterized protein n=1 Tax=Colletotrichum orbiculare (strain 104-T / ATCC 96160 / CBS 514.97 / LARS 414 / MAFF 240422) TaxID=1213857 RepID=A0A484G364_COLOR|nr:hypothetical protein Cob_v002121 [Colletotrichum orbiculare MAFF 240422]